MAKSGAFITWRKAFDDEVEAIETDLNTTASSNREDAGPPEQNDDEIERHDLKSAYAGHSKQTEKVGADYLTGICLSGGGVRSAVISLGILNKFSDAGMLKHFDYLTSVSGGGYAGAALSHWRAEREKVSQGEGIPFDPGKNNASAKFAASYLDFVRRHVSYLLPGGASGFFAGLFVVMRAILLNLYIWLLLGAAFVAAVMSVGYFSFMTSLGSYLFSRSQIEFLGNLMSWSGLEWRDQDHRVFLSFLVLALLCLIVLALAMMFFSLRSFFVRSNPDKNNRAATSPKYQRRRDFEKWGGRVLRAFLAFAIIGGLPVVTANLDALLQLLDNEAGDAGGGFFGVLFTLIGIGSAAYANYVERIGDKLKNANAPLAIIGSVFFVYGVAILAYYIAAYAWHDQCSLPHVFGVETGAKPCEALSLQFYILLLLTLLALALAYFVNINDVSLGRFYRDKLMETFLPNRSSVETIETATAGAPPAASFADSCALTDLSHGRPLHLVCANVLPTWLGDRKAKERLGDSFVLSRIFCGSDITGFQHTENVAQGNLRLATAMAASGAAAHARGGFTGKGPTASRPTALAMALLAVRLGYWLAWDKPASARPLNQYGNHLSPSLMSTLSHLTGYEWFSRRSGFIEVTDGGHFENLGLYELIRRRCGLIVVCEGGSDPAASYDSFTAALHRIKGDFGATVTFDIEIDKFGRNAKKTEMTLSGPENIVSRPDEHQFPKGTDFADKGYFLARVIYDDVAQPEVLVTEKDNTVLNEDGSRHHTKGPKEGLLIYLKSAMLRDLDHTTKGYRGANPDFPFDPTSNQFFTHEQFDAYFNVGETIAQQMLEETSLVDLFDEGPLRPALSKLLMNHYFQKQGPSKKGVQKK